MSTSSAQRPFAYSLTAALLAFLSLPLIGGCASEPARKPAPVTVPSTEKQAAPRMAGTTAPGKPTTTYEFKPLHQVAVLLPRSGELAGAAAALRDGFLAAYYSASPSGRPQVSFYDTSNAGEAPRLYQEAVANGADLVVGPLQKEGVAALMRVHPLPVPVLALNRVEDSSGGSDILFMYALAPEDEAAEVADRAWADGHKVALILKPEDGWGERVQRSFSERWSALGGVVAASQGYDPNAHEYAEAIGQLLRLKQSQERHDRMQTTLGRQIEFQPRRRQDAGFIFLIAQNQRAQELWPQLQFAQAGDLPVYATSSVYSGALDNRSDTELAGILFPDLPWLLRDDPQDPLSRSALAPSLPEVKGPYARLFAMGMDSYELAVRLGQIARQPGSTVAGRTGTLSLDAERRINRRLLWARMSDSGPRVVGPADTRAPRGTAESPGGVAALR